MEGGQTQTGSKDTQRKTPTEISIVDVNAHWKKKKQNEGKDLFCPARKFIIIQGGMMPIPPHLYNIIKTQHIYTIIVIIISL